MAVTAEGASDGARYVLLTTLTVFAAFLLRDIINQILEYSFDQKSYSFWKKIGCSFAVFSGTFVIVLAISMLWQNYGTFQIS
jgi:hypothetical protein